MKRAVQLAAFNSSEEQAVRAKLTSVPEGVDTLCWNPQAADNQIYDC